MGKTSITISEELVATAAAATGGGEIATVLKAVRGRADKVYTIASASELRRIYGESNGLDYKYCNYLLNRGNILRIIRAAFTGGTAATCKFPFAESAEAGANGLTCTAITAGTGYNGIKVEVVNQGGTGKDNVFSLFVYDDKNAVLEIFNVVSLNPDSEFYFGKSVKSDIITLSIDTDYTGQVLFGEHASIVKTMAGGTVVTDTADYTGPLAYLENKEISFATLILPTCTPANAALYAKSLVAARRDFLFLIDPEEDTPSTTVSDVISALNVTLANSEDYSYLASYYPRGVMSSFAGTVPPSIAIADLIAKLHQRKLWFKAPAGLENGLLTDFIDVAKDLTAKEVGDLQEAGINPIVIKTGTGVVAWGQSTKATSVLYLKKLATRLLTNYLKRTVYALSQRFIFADHTEFTWNQWKNSVEPIVRDIANVNGLRAFEVICDRSIMTQEDINNGIMRGVVRIWPNSQIEKLEVKFVIDNTGVSFE